MLENWLLFSLSPVHGAELYITRNCESESLWEPNSPPDFCFFFVLQWSFFKSIHLISLSCLPVSSSRLIPPFLRSLVWERALTTSSFITQRLNPLFFGQKKKVQHFFPCSSELPVHLTGSPRWMQPAELIAPCYWRSASLCDTHAVQPYGCPLGEEFD